MSFFGAYHLTRNRIYFSQKNLPFKKRNTRKGILLSAGVNRQGFIKGLSLSGFKM